MIIDDEEFCRETLKDLAQESNKGVRIIAEASSIQEGLDKLKAHHPRVAFFGCEGG